MQQSRASLFISRILSLLLVIVLISSMFPWMPKVLAEKEGMLQEAAFGYNLTEWLMDEQAGYIYALSRESNKLLFIRISDLQIETELNIGSAPSDLDVYGNQLYVALSDANRIQAVDIQSKSLGSIFETSVFPERLTVDQDRIYYVENHCWCNIYAYDLKTGQTGKLAGVNKAFSDPDLIVDPAGGTLYVGETGSTGSNMYAIDTQSGAIISKTTYKEGYGFSFPERKLLLNGGKIFYAGRQFDLHDLSLIFSDFPGGTIRAVNDNFIASIDNEHSLVSNRLDYQAFADIPDQPSLVALDRSNQLYTFHPATKTVRKSAMVPNPHYPVKAISTPDGLTFNQGIIDWVLSENEQYIYTIFEGQNRILTLDAQNLSVVDNLFVGSKTNDLDYAGGRLYAANSGSTQIAVMDTGQGTAPPSNVSYIYVDTNPYFVEAAEQGVLYYAGTDQWQNLRVYNPASGGKGEKLQINGVSFDRLYSPRLLQEPADGALYAGDSSSLYKIDLATLTVQSKAENGSYAKPIVQDGENLYFGARRMNANVLDSVYGTYGGEVIYAKGAYVFTSDAIYDRDTYQKLVDFQYSVGKVMVKRDGSVLVYDASSLKLRKYGSMAELMQALAVEVEQPKPPTELAWNLAFTDTDREVGKIGGSVTWNGLGTDKHITSYELYLLDAGRQKLGAPLGETPVLSAGNSSYQFMIGQDTPLPVGALYLGLYAKNQIGSSSLGAFIPLVDVTMDTSYYPMMPQSPHLMDRNPAKEQKELEVRWYDAIEKERVQNYVLYFGDIDGNKVGEAVASVPRNLSSTDDPSRPFVYSYVFEQSIPAEAYYVLVYSQDMYGNEERGTEKAAIYDNLTSESVSSGTGGPGAPSVVPYHLQFDDMDAETGKLAGKMYWYVTGEETEVTGYMAYFLDSNNKRLRPIMERRGTIVHDMFDQAVYQVYLPSIEIPAGAKKIGIFAKNEQGEHSEGSITSIWDMPIPYPVNVSYIDKNPKRSEIEGVVSWQASLDETPIVGYAVQFVDFGNDHFQIIGGTPSIITKGASTYSVNLKEYNLPTEPTHVLITPVNEWGEKAPSGAFVQITDNVSGEIPEALPQENLDDHYMYFSGDSDGDRGELSGDVSYFLVNEIGLVRYQLFIADGEGKSIQILSELTATGDTGPIRFHIPRNTKIASGGERLGIAVYKETGGGTVTSVSLTDQLYTPSLNNNQIVIKNNKDAEDTLTVTGLKAGDAVRVYRSQDVYYPLAEGMVADGASSITISMGQLGTQSGQLYVAVKSGTGLESLRTLAAYETEQKAGSGIGGGFGGGGGGAAAPPDETDGGTKEITDKEASKLLTNHKSQGSPLIVQADAEISGVKFTREGFSALSKGIGGSSIIVQSGSTSFEVSPELQRQVADALTLAGEGSRVSILLERTSEEQARTITASLERSGAKVLAAPVDFKVEIQQADGTSKPLGSFTSYTGRTFELGSAASGITAGHLAGVLVDPDTGIFHPVPSTFMMNEDGRWIGSLFRKGNSTYTVVEHSKTFTDVDAGNYAKEAIEALASRFVLSGYEDGTFHTERPVTRAEAAVMLTRSLGIVPTAEEASPFTDVTAEDWFAPAAVAAAASGLIAGYEDGTFRADAPVTRQELAVMLKRAMTYAGASAGVSAEEQERLLAPFVDRAAIAEWASEAVGEQVRLGILQGYEDATFQPNANADRGQLAVMLYRTLKQLKFIN
ncbi:S-layer homology domain-containing protein [Paenibacillus caseinilyticus]|uniref:SLH domain-containing protein n=1 Tax=Paenibacillus mucilaginosus K02 TaxID=997761 RepID=I0BGX3_9BACL|nr:S-layer homology domain-containing protein [Paenibacillus mucilaginosus]AFH61620.2 hypothetical protein B2K_12980 [Paenibacillus mucilaginosus K02]